MPLLLVTHDAEGVNRRDGAEGAGLRPAPVRTLENLVPPNHFYRRGCWHPGPRTAGRLRAPDRLLRPRDFIFDPERDEYRCPQDHPLRRYAVKHTECPHTRSWSNQIMSR